VLRCTGAFDTLTWRSSTNEFWNGFTVGVQGTAVDILPCDVDPTLPRRQSAVPDPGILALFAPSAAGIWQAR
jgi:hypothetical protein